MWRTVLLGLACLAGPGWCGTSASSASEGEAPAVPRRVLAFYYAWYAGPEVSGRWAHWEGVDLQAKSITSSTHYPVVGAYDSADPAVIDRHMRQLAEAGIDGPIVSWWGPRAFDSDRMMPRILEAAQAQGRVVSAYLEELPGSDRIASAADQLVYLLEKYGSHPAWLRQEGRPVVFVYGRAVDELGPLERWEEVRRRVVAASGVDPFLVGDRFSPEAAEVFDGLHTYNPAGEFTGVPNPAIGRAYRLHAELGTRLARSGGRLACVTIIPGYDDTKIRKPGLRIDRFDGATYAAGWDAAVASAADWALITTWNEWHEGSEIEPSIELGDSALRSTPDLATRFRSRVAGVPALADPTWAAFARSWNGGTIALLAPRSGGVTTSLIASGLPLRIVGLNAMRAGSIDPSTCPIVVFAGGETGALTGGTLPPLDKALRHYLDRGGVLVWASPEPWPLYHDTGSGDRGWSRKVGLNLGGGFETRPDSPVTIRFLGSLEHLGEVPYPATGDPRFRSFLAAADPAARFTSLAELVDGRGGSLGCAVAEVSAGPGRMIYVANRIPDAVDPVRLWSAILSRAARPADRPAR